jgi:ribosomal protein L11 methylase PrmA
VVIANILAPVIIQLLSEKDLLSYVTPNGRLILSGIIEEQGAGVVEALAAAGGRALDVITSGDWVTFVAGHR